MKRVQKFKVLKYNLRIKNPEIIVFLRFLCHMAKNVYNNALYTLRQQYFADKTIPTYFDLNKLMKDAEKNLLKFRDLITEYNSKHPEVPYREPKAMIIICGTIDMAYTLKSVVKVVSVGCIRN